MFLLNGGYEDLMRSQWDLGEALVANQSNLVALVYLRSDSRSLRLRLAQPSAEITMILQWFSLYAYRNGTLESLCLFAYNLGSSRAVELVLGNVTISSTISLLRSRGVSFVESSASCFFCVGCQRARGGVLLDVFCVCYDIRDRTSAASQSSSYRPLSLSSACPR